MQPQLNTLVTLARTRKIRACDRELLASGSDNRRPRLRASMKTFNDGYKQALIDAGKFPPAPRVARESQSLGECIRGNGGGVSIEQATAAAPGSQ